MPFVRIRGVKGLVFAPEKAPRERKHPCVDCFRCLFCPDDRCAMCRAKDAVDVSKCVQGVRKGERT